MRGDDDRWVEVTPSQFDHEREGLEMVKALLPSASPYRAWSNFEFRDNHGRWHEVDLLVLGRGRLHLVELKYYSGVLRGDDHRWVRPGKRAENSPLKLARRKAQYFATKLTDELLAWAREKNTKIPDTRDVVPFVQESVFLHHPSFKCEVSDGAAIGLYGPDGAEDQTWLPGISDLLLESPRADRVIRSNQEQILAMLMKRIGLVQRREREAGSWIIQEDPIAEGTGWQDWLATHKVVQTDQARIRFRMAPPGSPDEVTDELRRVAEHEFRTMSHLHHDGLLGPRDMVESDLGVGLVYPFDKEMQRLDLWLAEQEGGLPLSTQLSVVRQIAEAVHYAHGNGIAHRGLAPEAIWVRPHGDDGVKVLVGDWDSAGIAASTPATGLPSEGVTSLMGANAPSSTHTDEPADADLTGLPNTFMAPEGAWRATSTSRFRLDVFGVGALTYYLLTGQAPAQSAAALRDRLREQNGLDLSPVLPQISEALRSLVLGATRPSPSERTADLGAFLESLAAAERGLTTTTDAPGDPLDATPGAVLGDRFRLERRLGRGSTAVGLLVTDLQGSGEPERVLKVALDDAAAKRLDDEAAVLARLHDPRLVALVEGPISVDGRTALVLESAGTQTLSDVLRSRPRMSLDLLQRYGTDLLEALVALDKAGVDHRDIKPSNLGVRTQRGDRAKHLVLFDFSLTRAAASATSAGTPPYLDPFLIGERDRYDSAAERYAASVVLFEMATGHTAVYGDDPQTHPASVPHEATINREMFDPSIADALVDFFSSALARDASRRHDTAAEMLSRWKAIFPDGATTVPDDAEELAEAAAPETALSASGLSARALSALEPLDVQTVGDLVVVDPVRLNQLSGVADATRREVKSRARVWRGKFAKALRGLAQTGSALTGLPDPSAAADLLLQHTGSKRSTGRPAMVRLVLGISTDLDPFATQAQLAAHLPKPVTTARATQLLTGLQDAWASNDQTHALLTGLEQIMRARLRELGGVATTHELVTTLLGAMGQDHAFDDQQEWRLTAGILRLLVDRQRALMRADADVTSISIRRRGGRVVVLATDQILLDLAESLGREADSMVAAGSSSSVDGVVPPARVSARLKTVLSHLDPVPAGLQEPIRLTRLAASMSTQAAASGAGELHHRDLPPRRAVALTLGGLSTSQRLSAKEIRDRVHIRFPALTPLPERPGLDTVIDESEVDLHYDEALRVYRSTASTADTTGLQTRQATHVVHDAAPISTAGVTGQRLADSIARRSFLALGAPGYKIDRLTQVLTARYDAKVIDVTAVLLDAIKQQASAVGMPWESVRAADAAPANSRPALGLAALVSRSLPAVNHAVDSLMSTETTTAGPVLLTEAAPLARYGHMSELTRWTDLTRSRGRAVWLLVPQLRANQGPMLDGHPVELNASGQFLRIDSEWIDTQDRDLATTHSATTATAGDHP